MILVTYLDSVPEEERIRKDLQNLRDIVGHGAYLSLRRGGTLHIWRGSIPFNIFVKNRKQRTLWHSDDQNRGPGVQMFDKISDSKEQVDVPGSARFLVQENGSPFESIFVLKQEYLA